MPKSIYKIIRKRRIRRWKLTTLLPLFLLLLFSLAKLLLGLLLLHSVLSICRKMTPTLGHRQVYFGREWQQNENNKENGGGGGSVPIDNKMKMEKEEEEKRRWQNGRKADEAVLDKRRLAIAEKWLKAGSEFLMARKLLFLNETSVKIKKPWLEKEEQRLAIGIVSTRRNNMELTQLVGHLIKSWLHESENGDLTQMPPLFVCNTEARGQRTDELVQLEQQSGGIFQVIDLNMGMASSKTMTEQLTTNDRIWKESGDYWKCLKALATTKPMAEYFLLLEDDVLPIPYFFRSLSSLIDQLDAEKRLPIDYVKLFHPWHWRGIPWAFQSLAISLCFGYLLAAIPSRWHQKQKQTTISNLLFALQVSAATACAHILIRREFYQLFSELHFHLTGGPLLTTPESCCTHAVLFRASSAREMASALATIPAGQGHAKDHILDASRFVGRQTDFNLVVHIGWFSALRQKRVHTGEMFPHENCFILQ